MSEASDRYATVADAFAARLGGMTDDKRSAPSPCTEWTARDVVVHVINTHRRVRAALGDVPAAEVGPDANLEAEWSSATDAIRTALADAGLASQTVGGMFGEQPFESLVGRLLCADTLIHTWDLARATGQDDRLDVDASAKALEFLATRRFGARAGSARSSNRQLAPTHRPGCWPSLAAPSRPRRRRPEKPRWRGLR